MKQYIKNGIIYNTPIKIETDGIITYTNDQSLILANGYEVYVIPQPEKTLQQLINQSNNRINKICDRKILNDFVWNNEQFYLTMENQTNFANMYMIRDLLTYPQTIKTKTGYIQLYNYSDVENFYISGVNFVKQCLEQCWTNKQQQEQRIRREYASSYSSESNSSII